MSAMTMSAPGAFAARMLSNRTVAGSPPSWWRTISTSNRSAQTSNWSIAAARKVSAAAKYIFFPSA